MKRKAPEEAHPVDYFSQGVPHHITLDGQALKRLFVQDPEKKLRISDTPPEGQCLIVGDNFGIIMLRRGEDYLCLKGKGQSRIRDSGDKHRSKMWCYDYRLYIIGLRSCEPFKYDISDR